MKHKVAELEGAQLDAAVAVAEGLSFRLGPWDTDPRRVACYVDSFEYMDSCMYDPSEAWAIGGPIIERERISLVLYGDVPGLTQAYVMIEIGDGGRILGSGSVANGLTPLIAAMRAYVASKFGDDIDLPS